jgi:aminoglycoside 6'-N-acetyltransferase I
VNADSIQIREAVAADQAEWIAMRRELWPGSDADHHVEVAEYFSARTPRTVTLVALLGQKLIGFLELSSRDYAQGCETSPVAYIEGWYVDATFRRAGVGRRLVLAAEAWARNAGYRELGSDAEASNDGSIRAHAALGYERAPDIVCFRKTL